MLANLGKSIVYCAHSKHKAVILAENNVLGQHV